MLLDRVYRSQSFNPRWWGVLVNPFFTNRRGLHREVSRCARQIRGGKLLDIGCGIKPYRDLFDVDVYWGLDIPKDARGSPAQFDLLYDGACLPFREGSIDHILLSEVLEHAFQPQELLAEIRRVLKQGGFLLLTVPFLYHEHEQPYDFGRYTSRGLEYLLIRNGFEICHAAKNGNAMNTLAQVLSSHIFTETRSWPAVVRMLIFATICSTILIVGEVLGKLMWAESSVYLGTIVLARKAVPVDRSPSGNLFIGISLAAATSGPD